MVKFSLIGFAFLLCAFAHAQQPGYQQQSTYNPSNVAFPARAMVLSQDPFQGVNFQMCVSAATMGKVNDPLTNTVNAGMSFFDQIKNYKDSQDKLSLEIGCDAPLADVVPTACSAYAKAPDSSGKKKKNKDEAPEFFDAKKVVAFEKKLDERLKCKNDKAKQAEAAAKCFGEQFEILKQNLGEVKKDFDEAIASMNKYNTELDAKIETEQGKIEAMKGKVGQFENSQKEVQAVLDVIDGPIPRGELTTPKNVSSLKATLTQYNGMKKKLDREKQQAKASRTLKCLSGPLQSFSTINKCSFGTAYECIMNNYHRDRVIAYGGGKAANRKADADRADFDRDLRLMVNDLSNATFYTDVEQLIQKYQGRLSKRGVNGLVFANEMRACSKNVQKEIDNELLTKTEELGSQAQAMEDLGGVISTEAGDIIHKLDTVIRNTGNTIFGSELNQLIDGHGCNTKSVTGIGGSVKFTSVDLQTQYDCAKGMTENLRSMLNGTIAPGSTVPLKVSVGVNTEGKTQYCQGIRDCLQKAKGLQTESEKREKAMLGNGTYTDPLCAGGVCPGKKKFTNDANSNIQKQFAAAAESFKNSVSVAKQQLKTVKDLFAKSGIDFPAIDENDKTPFKCSGDTICELPTPFDDKIASAAGLPLINSAKFTEIQKTAKDKQTTYAADYKTEKEKLAAKAKECKRELREELVEEDKRKIGSSETKIAMELQACLDQAALAGISDTEDEQDLSKVNELMNNIKTICDKVKSTDAIDQCATLSSKVTSGKQTCKKAYLKAIDDAWAKRGINRDGTPLYTPPVTGAPTK